MIIKDIRYSEQILFIVVFSVLLYGAFFRDDSDSVQNYKRGIQAGVLVLIAEGCLKNYSGAFIRPNEAFWRMVSRFCLIYFLALVFLLFQNVNDARTMLKHLYPELGVPINKDMHTYDDNCEFEWKNIYDNMDHYFLVHIVNWFLASLILRNAYILHFWSILDEILELSWQHILPHFRECWWDHVLLDVLFSNTPAIFLGMAFVKLCGIKEYDWFGKNGKKSIRDWKIFNCHRYWGGLCGVLTVISLNFICGFFLINSLWVPPKNYLTIYRLIVWFLLGNLVFKEVYVDIETWGTKQRKTNPISGKMRWMCLGITVLEVVLSWKFRHNAGNIMDAEWPLYILVPWLSTIGLAAIFYLYLRFKPGHTTIYGDKKKKKALQEDLDSEGSNEGSSKKKEGNKKTEDEKKKAQKPKEKSESSKKLKKK